jgi:hypothetical protein
MPSSWLVVRDKISAMHEGQPDRAGLLLNHTSTFARYCSSELHNTFDKPAGICDGYCIEDMVSASRR